MTSAAPPPPPQPAVAEGRLAAQLLTGPPAASPVDATQRLLAIQAQDMRGAKLAVRARTSGLTAADFEHELTQRRSLVIGWLNRGTLHLVRAEDYWWLHALTTPPLFTASARRLGQEGVPPPDAERGVEMIARSLASDGPLTRGQLGERIAAAGVRTKGQALVHILFLACLRGIAVRGPMAGHEQCYVLTRDWLGPPPAALDRDQALAELARRYLAGHGPASDRDLAQWAGLPLRDARAGLSAIAASLTERDDGLADLAGRGAAHGLPPPRLLGPYEPLLLGWSSRDLFLHPSAPVVAVNGLFRPFALVGGQAVATWSLAGGKPALEPFRVLAPAVAEALTAEAADVERYLAAGQVKTAGQRGSSGSPAAG
jgi:winged helix DNA-binding protein